MFNLVGRCKENSRENMTFYGKILYFFLGKIVKVIKNQRRPLSERQKEMVKKFDDDLELIKKLKETKK